MPLGSGGGWHSLNTATATAGAASFSPSRHFMPEQAQSGQRDHSCAVRHRMSGLHSFRTAVVSEWVLCGRVAYEITLESIGALASPAAIGVGCVAPTCDVNCDTAWAPGTWGWRDCWGVCIEEHPTEEHDPSLHEIRAIGTHRAVYGGRFGPGPDGEGGARMWAIDDESLNVQVGDVLHAIIDIHSEQVRRVIPNTMTQASAPHQASS